MRPLKALTVLAGVLYTHTMLIKRLTEWLSLDDWKEVARQYNETLDRLSESD